MLVRGPPVIVVPASRVRRRRVRGGPRVRYLLAWREMAVLRRLLPGRRIAVRGVGRGVPGVSGIAPSGERGMRMSWLGVGVLRRRRAVAAAPPRVVNRRKADRCGHVVSWRFVWS